MSEGLEFLRHAPRARLEARPEAPEPESAADWFVRILSEAIGPNPLDAIFPADSNLGLSA